jgi:hypothetical protein
MNNLYIVIFALLLGFSSCEKTKNPTNSIPDGTYFGTFQRFDDENIGQTANVSISLLSGKWFGESDLEKYPALCRGTYKVDGNKLIFINECAWTAEFDWSLILSGEYSFVFEGDSLTFSKVIANPTNSSSVDIYKLALPKEGLKESPIVGVWVESVSKKDTMEFMSQYDGTFPIFTLKRESQIIDGNNIPGHFSGPYYYKLLQNSISTQWFLSSNSAFFRNYFKMDPSRNEFKIGTFFDDSSLNNDTLTFVKIK